MWTVDEVRNALRFDDTTGKRVAPAQFEQMHMEYVYLFMKPVGDPANTPLNGEGNYASTMIKASDALQCIKDGFTEYPVEDGVEVSREEYLSRLMDVPVEDVPEPEEMRVVEHGSLPVTDPVTGVTTDNVPLESGPDLSGANPIGVDAKVEQLTMSEPAPTGPVGTTDVSTDGALISNQEPSI